MTELEKIDLIRTRTGVSFREAKIALDEANGEVIQALINLEEGLEGDLKEDNGEFCSKVYGKSEEMLGWGKQLIDRGMNTKIKVKQDEKTIFEVPAAVGVLGVLAALAKKELALIGLLGGVVAVAKNYTLEVCHQDEQNGYITIDADDNRETC